MNITIRLKIWIPLIVCLILYLAGYDKAALGIAVLALTLVAFKVITEVFSEEDEIV